MNRFAALGLACLIYGMYDASQKIIREQREVIGALAVENFTLQFQIQEFYRRIQEQET